MSRHTFNLALGLVALSLFASRLLADHPVGVASDFGKQQSRLIMKLNQLRDQNARHFCRLLPHQRKNQNEK